MSQLTLLTSGQVSSKADHLAVMHSLEGMLATFCAESMHESVQLQVRAVGDSLEYICHVVPCLPSHHCSWCSGSFGTNVCAWSQELGTPSTRQISVIYQNRGVAV